MYITRKIIKRGEQRIKLTPEEIKQAYEIQLKINTNKEIIKKLKEWIKFIEEEKNVDKVIDKFTNLFENIYTYDQTVDNEDEYFESIDDEYSIEDEIILHASSGDWDRFGSEVSHVGTDLFLKSKLSNNEEYNKGICIFSESEYEDNIDKLNRIVEEYEEIKINKLYDNN